MMSIGRSENLKTPAACGLLLWLTVAGCTSMPSFLSKSRTAASTTLAKSEAQNARTVKAVRLETEMAEGQTSWQIEPAVSWIPKGFGAEAATSAPPQIEKRLRYAFDLAQRGATYSASDEFLSVLGLCALELDTRERGRKHRTALQEGYVALQEAEDFTKRRSALEGFVDVHRIATAHQTPLGRELAKKDVDAIVAVQLYYEFAEQRLAYACTGMPVASLALYGLGRTATLLDTNKSLSAARAVALHRTALAVAPSNTLAANELGVLLAQHGQMLEAEGILRHAVAENATSEAWQNLAIVCARLGKHDESRYAHAQAQQLAPEGKSDFPSKSGARRVAGFDHLPQK